MDSRGCRIKIGLEKLKFVQHKIAQKIGFNLDFGGLTESELKLYFIFFDEELMDMVEHMEILIIVYGMSSIQAHKYSNCIGSKIVDLSKIWAGFVTANECSN